jgi:hypothetical protein
VEVRSILQLVEEELIRMKLMLELNAFQEAVV